MKKFAFKMKLKPGRKEEYRRRHDEIWSELKELLSKSGVQDYTIFLDELLLKGNWRCCSGRKS